MESRPALRPSTFPLWVAKHPSSEGRYAAITSRSTTRRQSGNSLPPRVRHFNNSWRSELRTADQWATTGMPTAPTLFQPQQYAVPSAVTAHVAWAPTPMVVNFNPPATATGA